MQIYKEYLNHTLGLTFSTPGLVYTLKLEQRTMVVNKLQVQKLKSKLTCDLE